LFNLKTKRTYNDLLNLAFRTLQEDLGLANKITVVGAHAIYSNYFAGLIDLAEETRETTDLDLDYFGDLSELDYFTFQDRFALRLNELGLTVSFKPIKVRETSVIYKFQVTNGTCVTPCLKIDFSSNLGTWQYEVLPIEHSLARKIQMCNRYVDRRAKDKVDVYNIIAYKFPNGISKGEILDLLAQYSCSFNLNPRWSQSDALEIGLQSFKNFKPKDAVNGVSHRVCLLYIQNLLLSLASSDVPNSQVL
jgi:hypothetical protein